MLGFLRARRRITASALAAALWPMLLATCLTAAAQPDRRMLCCPTMQDCGTGSIESPCCTVPSSPSHALIPARPADLQRLVATVAVTLPLAVEKTVERSPSARAAHTSTSPPGVPTYLFVASFRI